MSQEDNEEEFIDNLILAGALEPSGLDKDGEMLFSFTEKLAEVDPNLYKNMQEIFYEDIKFLWSHGFLDMDITDQNPTVKITEKALDIKAVSKLPPEMSRTLGYIVHALRR